MNNTEAKDHYRKIKEGLEAQFSPLENANAYEVQFQMENLKRMCLYTRMNTDAAMDAFIRNGDDAETMTRSINQMAACVAHFNELQKWYTEHGYCVTAYRDRHDGVPLSVSVSLAA